MMDVTAPEFDIIILGSLRVRAGGTEIDLGSTKQRRLLAMLLMRSNSAVTVSCLIDAVWLDNPPRTARKNLQVYISGLRKIFPGRISYSWSGYVFRAAAGELDLLRFDELSAAGRRAIRGGDSAAAVDLLGSAVGLWDGRVADGLWEPGQGPDETARLRDRYLAVYEDWIDAMISVGSHVEALENMDSTGDPGGFRERTVMSRMRALQLCGRIVEALSFYEEKRQYLAHEYGIDPSPVLQGMYQSLLVPSYQGVTDMFESTQSSAVAEPAWQLPRPLPDLVERPELRDLIRVTTGIKVIWGRVGTGKTVLAVHAAHLLSEDFPDGVLFLASRSQEGTPKSVLAAVRELLCAVGLSAAVPADEAAATGLWRSWTRSRKVLLLIDDAPGEDFADILLPSSPESLVLVTSRSRLSGLEADQWVEVGEFTEGEAIALLGRLIGVDRTGREPGATARIAAFCSGSPLAIRAAAGKLSALPRMPLADFASRLDDGDPFPGVIAGQGAAEQRYERWFAELPDEGKAAARCLAAFSGGSFTHTEARQALAFEGFAPDRVFELLAEHGMVTAAPAPDEVTAHALADVASYAELYELPPLVRGFLARVSDLR
jgi:DNA-binding SARP family transcriptional activator